MFKIVFGLVREIFEPQLDWSRQLLLLQKGHPLRLRRWPEQLAVCFLAVLVNTSDFRIAAMNFSGFFEPIVFEYVKWIFLLTFK